MALRTCVGLLMGTWVFVSAAAAQNLIRPPSPESQGLDSSVLASLLDHIERQALPVHSVVIMRRNAVVLDATIYPFTTGSVHDIASATKSVTSILIGIAIDKGFIRSVQEPVAGLLSFDDVASTDSRRARMTVEHLLTMQSGLACGIEPGERELAAMRAQDDWAKFAFALPMASEPGTRYAYCSCNHHLLSAIISARTGMSALEFARKHLFAPLGITGAIWPADPRGRTHGWGDLRLHPRHLARLGQLFLQGGRWNGQQVVSEAWVRQSIVPRATVRQGVGYGYSWWINTAREPAIFEMTGRGGQRVAVVPDKDLVVSFNSGGVNTDDLAPFLFKAIRSDGALPEDAMSFARLRQRVAAVARPPETPLKQGAVLPAMSRSISGRRYAIAPNPLGMTELSFAFSGRSEARATLQLFGREYWLPVGLDGRVRFSSGGPEGLRMATTGRWKSDTSFVLDLDTVANINHFIIQATFQGDEVRLRINETTGEVKDLEVSGKAVY